MAPAAADPWAEVGAAQIRQDAELLRAFGLAKGPVNAWPLPWPQLLTAPEAIGAAGLPPHVASALRRTRAASEPHRYDLRVSVTNRPTLVRDFMDAAREELDLAFSIEERLGRLHLSLGAGFRPGQDGGDLHAEPSYAALELGDWLLYGGYVEHWWGPARENALLFSNNARPFPKIGIKRVATKPFDVPVLRLLGPVQIDAFAGVLTEARNDFNNPALAGIRIGFAPVKGLEIGLNRALQLCGQGRPCNAAIIFDALLPMGNADNTGTLNEPGNQLAGYDISYTRMFGPISAKIYVEAEAEDENNIIVEQYGRLGGLNLAGPWGKRGSAWELRAEFIDTLAAKLFGNGWRYRGSFYNHHIYRDGYTYRSQSIGSSLDGDGKMLTIAAALTDARDRRLYGSFRTVTLNRTERPGHRISVNGDRLRLFTVGADLPTPNGELSLQLRAQDNTPNSLGRSPLSAQAELGWRLRL